jgi:hypothetical protein
LEDKIEIKRFSLVVFFSVILCVSTFSQVGNDGLVSALNMITNDAQRRAELLDFVKGLLEHGGVSYYEELPYEYHGVNYSYEVNGKYLFVLETMYGGAGSSYEDTNSYIIDTDLKRLIETKRVFTNLSDASLERLILEYLSQLENFDWIRDRTLLQESIRDGGFSLFYRRNGVGIHWDKGSIAANAAGAFEIILPYSRVQNFLTAVGREAFR